MDTIAGKIAARERWITEARERANDYALTLHHYNIGENEKKMIETVRFYQDVIDSIRKWSDELNLLRDIQAEMKNHAEKKSAMRGGSGDSFVRYPRERGTGE